MPIALPALGGLVVVLWVIAFILLAAVILGYIAGVLRGLPFPLNKLAGPIESAAQALSNVLYKAIHLTEQLVGAGFHLLARYTDKLWHQLEFEAGLLAQFGDMVLRLVHAHALLRALVHRAVGTAEAVLPRVKRLEKEYHGIEHQVKQLERDITKGIGHDLRIQVKALEQDVTKLESKVIPSIRSIADTAEADVTALRRWVTENVPLIGTAALTAAVAWALSQIGLGGLRCNSLLNSLSKRGCGLWSGLEDLLGLFVDTLLLTNICTLLPILETAVSEVADPLVVALTDVGAGLCSGGIGAAPPLHVPALSLPANPGITLNLP